MRKIVLSEEKHRFVNQNPHAVIEVDQQGKVIFCNTSAKTLFKIKDVSHHYYIQDFFSKEDDNVIQKHLLSSLPSEKFRIRLLDSLKQPFWSDINVTKDLNFANNGISVFWINDVSKEKEMADNIKEVKLFYKNILHNFPSDIVVFDKNHRYKFITPKAVANDEMREWLIGKDDYDYCKLTGKDNALADQRRKLFKDVVNSGEQFSMTESKIDSEGNRVHHLRNMLPIYDDSGQLEYVIGYGFNISSIKELEQQTSLFKLLLNESSESLIIVEENGNILFSNKFASTLTGIENLTGKPFSELNCFEVNDTGELEILKKLKEQKTLFSEGKILENGKIKCEIELKGNYIENESGSFYLVFINDITTRKNAERLLIEGKEIAETAAQDKSDFLSIMSHEIRTPLNAVIGLTHLILNDSPKPEHVEKLNILKFSGENLVSLVNNILDFNKIDNGKVVLENVRIPLEEMFQSIVLSLRHKAEEKNNVLEYFIDPKIPAFIEGDPTRLSQIFNNLVGNALKFTQAGKVLLSAELIEDTSKKINIKFSVKDTGIGIPKDKQDTIFKAFQQASTSTTREYGGTGLGLTITAKLAELFNSEIKIKSNENEGSEFYFHIECNRCSDNVKSKQRISQKNDPFTFVGKTILVVDDNPVNLMIAEEFLKKWGFHVLKAKDGKEGLDVLKKESLDIILLDLQMPVMDGYEAALKMRTINRTIPILAFTANQETEVFERIINSKMDGVISKPFIPEEFKKIIKTHLTKQH